MGLWGALKPPRFYLRGHLTVHAVAFAIVAGHMLWRAEVYTPATWRGLLFIVTWAHPYSWAAIFTALAVLKGAAAAAYPRLAPAALIGGIMVFSWWTVGLAAAALQAQQGATILPAVLAGLVVGEHFAALSMLERSRGGRWRWTPDDGG